MLEALLVFLDDVVPGIKVVRKGDSQFMKLLGAILFFAPEFMSRYTTTIGSTIYLSDNLSAATSLGVVPTIAHEVQHVYDSRKWWPVYILGYLSPQILVLLAFLSFVSPWWLLALVALLPLPSIGRMLIERRGYTVTLVCYYWMYGKEAFETLAPSLTKDQFAGATYYFMWPFKASMTKWFLTSVPKYATSPEKFSPVLARTKLFMEERIGSVHS